MLKRRFMSACFALTLIVSSNVLLTPTRAWAADTETTVAYRRSTRIAALAPPALLTCTSYQEGSITGTDDSTNPSALPSETGEFTAPELAQTLASTSSDLPVDSVRVRVLLSEAQAVDMLRAAQASGDSPLIDPQVIFGDDSLIQVHGQVAVQLLFGLTRYGTLVISGALVTASGALTFEPQQVTFDGLDVTTQYREQVRSLFSSGLTKMVPEHLYVESAQVSAGCVTVQGIETTPAP